MKSPPLPNESLNAQRLANDLIDLWITSDINGYKVAEESGYPDVEEAFAFARSIYTWR